VLTATVTRHAGSYSVTLQHPATGVTSQEVAPKDGPSPIAPELNELAWTAGAFVVFAVLMRYFLYPRLRKGIDARYNSIRDAHKGADDTRAAATSEVADYEAQLAGVKAQAAAHIDEARRTLEAERSGRLAQVNSELAAQRAAAVAENDAARQAVQGQIESAIGDVSSRAVELAVGKRPDAALVGRAVAGVMAAGGAK
jgi:F-type H+-transporting ATPase subunit b